VGYSPVSRPDDLQDGVSVPLGRKKEGKKECFKNSSTIFKTGLELSSYSRRLQLALNRQNREERDLNETARGKPESSSDSIIPSNDRTTQNGCRP